MFDNAFGFPVRIAEDLNGWSVTLRGAGVSPFGSVVELMHLLIGGGTAVAGLALLVSLLLNGSGTSALQLVPFIGIGGFFAYEPMTKLFRLASRTTIEVSGQSVRIEQRVAGLRFRRVQVPLASCSRATIEGPFWSQYLHLDAHRFPVFVEKGGADLLTMLHEGAEHAARDPDVLPPLPRALAELRASAEQQPH